MRKQKQWRSRKEGVGGVEKRENGRRIRKKRISGKKREKENKVRILQDRKRKKISDERERIILAQENVATIIMLQDHPVLITLVVLKSLLIM